MAPPSWASSWRAPPLGALIPEIVRRGLQELLEAEVSALTGAQLHERCPDQRSTHRNGYRRRLLTTQVGDLTLAIPKLRQGSFFPDWLEPRHRVDKALYAAGLIQSPSQALLPVLSGWVEVGGIAPSLCWKAPPLQTIST